MKKNNPFGIIILIAISVAFGYLLGTVLGWILGMKGFNVTLLIIVPLSAYCFCDFANLVIYPIAKSTMNRNIKKHNFGKTTTYVSRANYTLKSILCIDEETGRVGYVSLSDPFRFQIANPGELSKIRSTVSAFAQGGRRFVFFEFYYGENKMRFPTYRVRSAYSISSDRIQQALDEGNRICNLLLRFNPGGDDFSINRNIPFSKTGLWGFLLSFISIYVTVAAFAYEATSDVSHTENTQFVEFLPVYALNFIAASLAIAGFVLGVITLKNASVSPVRGKGFAKTSVIMSPIALIILILALTAFIRLRI